VLRPSTLAASEYLAARRAKSVPDYKIEPDALSKRHEARIRLASWGTVLSFAMTVLVFVLRFRGLLTAQSNLKWLAAFALLGAVVGSCVLAGREALRRAEREMVFVIDENAVVRKRKGWPDERIAFLEVSAIREELRWLVVESTEPYRKIAIPNDVKGYQAIRAELARHHPLSARTKSRDLRFVAAACGLLPWSGGLLIVVTRSIMWLAVAGVAITVLSTAGAYFVRKSRDPISARHWLIAEPMLFGCYYLFALVLVHYVLLRG
jgi:hypothetical protein